MLGGSVSGEFLSIAHIQCGSQFAALLKVVNAREAAQIYSGHATFFFLNRMVYIKGAYEEYRPCHLRLVKIYR